MTEELMACPFCGSTTPSMKRPDAVWCGSCLAEMPEHDPDVPNAVARWNTRLSHSAEKEALIEALEKIVEGDVPRPIAKPWRADGQYSKLDQCEHGLAMHDDCGRCIENFARSTLLSMRNNGNG